MQTKYNVQGIKFIHLEHPNHNHKRNKLDEQIFINTQCEFIF